MITTIFRTGEIIREASPGQPERRWLGVPVSEAMSEASKQLAEVGVIKHAAANGNAGFIPAGGDNPLSSNSRTPRQLTTEPLPTAPFVAGSSTSHEAAVRADSFSTKQRARVLAWIVQRGSHGGTSDEIEDALGISHQSAGPRIRELEKSGEIVRTTRTRPTKTGRSAGVLLAAGVEAELF